MIRSGPHRIVKISHPFHKSKFLAMADKRSYQSYTINFQRILSASTSTLCSQLENRIDSESRATANESNCRDKIKRKGKKNRPRKRPGATSAIWRSGRKSPTKPHGRMATCFAFVNPSLSRCSINSRPSGVITLKTVTLKNNK